MNDIKVITSFDEGDIINLVYRSESNGKKMLRKISDYEWHFAIFETDYDDEARRIINRFPKTVIRVEKTGNYYKIFCHRNNHKIERRDNFYNLLASLKRVGILPLEADLSMHKRFLLDKNLEIDENVNLLYFDIETDDTLKTIEIGRDRILSFAAADKKGNSYFEHGNEKEVLKKFLDLVREYDAICGWNSRDFDLPYIRARLEKYGMQYNWNKRIHVDLMRRLIKLFSPIMGILGLNGFSLDEVGRVFVDHQKIKFDGSIINLYNTDFDTFKRYNINDVLLTRKIDDKTKATDLMLKECKWTGTLLNRFYVGELLDNYILREAHKLNMYMPSRPSIKEKEDNAKIFIRGGFVRNPVVGVYDNMRIMDFKSLYPSVIVGWNVGIDSLNEELSAKGDKSLNEFLRLQGKKIEEIEFPEWYKFLREEKAKLDPEDKYYQTANNNFFRRDKDSFISTLIKNLLTQRKEFKKKMDELEIGTQEYNSARATQEVVKEMANCLHPSTLLYVRDKETKNKKFLSIKDLYYSANSYEIESYNQNTKNTEWKEITKVMKKNYSGEMIKMNFMHSLDLLCTPEHNIYVSDAKNLKTRITKGKNIDFSRNNENASILENSLIKKIEAGKISTSDAVVFQSCSKYDKIKDIVREKYDGEVFDIEVKDNHNFFVSGILVSNSMYGITADKSSRYFSKHVAESITLTGQFLNKTVTQIAKRLGYTTVYSDTDSIFVAIDDDNKTFEANDKINEILKDFLEKKLKLKNNISYLEYEKKFRRMIMLDKKRYVGVLSWMDGKDIDKFFSRGTEDVKKNTTKYAKEKFLDLVNLIIREKKDLEYIKKWLANVKEEVLTSNNIKLEDIVITTKVSKPVASYKTKPIHVRLAEEQINKGMMLDAKEEKNSWSNRIQYVVINSKNKNESVLAENFTGEWDRKYYWDVQIYAPIQRVLKVVWPDENWDEHNIVFMEKLEKKKEREEKREQKKIELEEKKKEREKIKEERKLQKELLAKEKEEKKKAKNNQLKLI